MTEQVILFTESILTLKGTEQLKTLFIGNSTYNAIQNISGAFVISKECSDKIALPFWKDQ